MARRYYSLYDWCMENGERGQQVMKAFVGMDIEDENVEVSKESWSEWADIGGTDNKVQMMKSLGFAAHQKVWWRCHRCNKLYVKKVIDRVRCIEGCTHCSTRVHNTREGASYYTLSDWCNKNGIYGEKIAEEWYDDKNIEMHNITMNDVSYKSNESVYWKCKQCGEEFEMSINQRTQRRCGCKKCMITGTSYPEQYIYFALQQVCPEVVNRKKLFGGYEYDIVVESKKVCVEYSGSVFHKDRVERDMKKAKLCKENGYRLITVWDKHEYDNDIKIEDDFIEFSNNCKYAKQHMMTIIKYIVDIIGGDFNKIDFEKVEYDTDCRMYRPLKDNVLTEYPMLELEFDKDKNKGLDLRYFKRTTHKEVWWKCTKCGNEWKCRIGYRAMYKVGCPKCHYCIFENIYKGSGCRSITRNKNFFVYRDFSL